MKKKQIIFHSLFFLMTLLVFVYGLLEFRKDIWSILGLGIVVLISAYLFIEALSEEWKRKAEREEELNKKINDLLVIDKAIFVAVKKNEKSITEQLEYIENKIE